MVRAVEISSQQIFQIHRHVGPFSTGRRDRRGDVATGNECNNEQRLQISEKCKVLSSGNYETYAGIWHRLVDGKTLIVFIWDWFHVANRETSHDSTVVPLRVHNAANRG